MVKAQTGTKSSQTLVFGEANAVCPSLRMHYLWPSRYFHFYVLYDRNRKQTCWLPEGYAQ